MGQNFTNTFVDADSASPQDVADAICDFWTDRGAQLRSHRYEDLDTRNRRDDGPGELGFAITPADEGWITVIDSHGVPGPDRALATCLASRFEAYVWMKGLLDVNLDRLERLFRPDGSAVPEQVCAELWTHLYGRIEPRFDWRRPYVEELDEMAQQLEKVKREVPDVSPHPAWYFWRYDDFGDDRDLRGREIDDVHFLVFDGVKPDDYQGIWEEGPQYEWVFFHPDYIGPMVIDVRREFDNPLEVPVDDPDAMRSQGFVPVDVSESIERRDGSVIISLKDDVDQLDDVDWCLVSIRDRRVRDSRPMDTFDDIDTAPTYVADTIARVYAERHGLAEDDVDPMQAAQALYGE